MNFNSGAFLLFLPAVVGLYWLLPHKARKYALLAASWFFYMYWNPLLILLLLASTAVDYCCGLGMERWRESRGLRKALLLCSVFMNLGMLFFFKYWDFFGAMVNGACAWAGIGYRVPDLNLILPVGISFYTFQTMSYTIDVYRGKASAERDPVYFALFVSYFPQLVAGPIEKPADLLPQLKAERRWNREDFTAGLRLLLCGFFRKCVVADQCGIYVNAAEFFFDLCDHRIHVRFLCDIRPDCHTAHTEFPADLCLKVTGFFFGLVITDHDVVSGFRHRMDDRTADAAGAAGYQHCSAHGKKEP